MTTEIESRLNLEVDPGTRARALHRVVRAMHDGHCPNCGYLDSSAVFYVAQRANNPSTMWEQTFPGHHRCPACGFQITDEESRAALEEFQPYFKESLKLFEEWRAERGKLPEGDSLETSAESSGSSENVEEPQPPGETNDKRKSGDSDTRYETTRQPGDSSGICVEEPSFRECEVVHEVRSGDRDNSSGQDNHNPTRCS